MRHRRAAVYGPVPSRRLGASQGVDVVPLKVCSYDCLYCQLGPTRVLRTDREAFYPVEELLAEVQARLGREPLPDTITIAGSGEPTLYSALGPLIEGIKRMTSTPVALLTNGAGFERPDVRADARRADIVLPSLDAGDERTFVTINRPAPGITLARVVQGLAAFRREFRGALWLEVMVVAGLNDSPAGLREIASLAARIAPDRIQLNTPVRPAFNRRAVPVSRAQLEDLCALFTPQAEVIATFRVSGESGGERPARSAEILELLRRRPCTLEEIAAGLDLHPNEVAKSLAGLETRREVQRVPAEGTVFWRALPARSDGADGGPP